MEKLRPYGIQLLSLFIACFLSICAGEFAAPLQCACAAANVTGLKQMERVLGQAVKSRNNKIVFTGAAYADAQIEQALQHAAKSQGRLLTGGIRVRRQAAGKGTYQYKVTIPDDALIKVNVLKSKAAAVKAAAAALKDGSYGRKYYSNSPYSGIFEQMLRQHPEYNYGTSVWTDPNGTYGYKRSAALTKKRQAAMMEAAGQAAGRIVKQCVKAGMSDRGKAKAIHDYIVEHCMYARTQNSATAYGALVEGAVICYGYSAAFNLLAAKCGLQSMAVCGQTLSGSAHAWTYVKLSGEYRYIDCTWDDTMKQPGERVSYTYFDIAAEKLAENHMWDQAAYPSSDIKYSKYFTE